MTRLPRLASSFIAGGLAFAGALVCMGPSPGLAHEAPYSYVDLVFTPGGRVECRIAAHPEDVARLDASEPAPLLASRVLIDGSGAAWICDGPMQPDPARNLLRGTATAAAPRGRRVAIDAWLFPEDPEHTTYVNVYEGGSLRVQELLDRTRSRFTYDRRIERADRGRVFSRFLREGIHHIFIGPDHILFIVGLILTGGGLRRLLKIVTAFTVAHSVTLALAVLGIVHPSARIVEPAIAASVVVVGAENLIARSRGRDLRPLLAFAFGLIHGFGFASVLQDLDLPHSGLAISLVAFNAGVEAGQAMIVLALAPALHAISRRNGRAGRRVAVAGSLAVMAAGGYWLVTRAFLG